MRPPWGEYWATMARLVATRATCPRASVGAVIVKHNKIVATGYNGAPSNMPHCMDVGCRIVDNHCMRVVHAEENAVWQVERLNQECLFDATMYVTRKPCEGCTELMRYYRLTVLVCDNIVKG